MPKQKPADDAEPEFTPRDYAEGGIVEPGERGLIVGSDERRFLSTPTLPAEVVVNFVPPAKHYEKKSWKGVMDVYQCSTCGHCQNEHDEIILHVITHAPASEQAQLFEQLMKEK